LFALGFDEGTTPRHLTSLAVDLAAPLVEAVWTLIWPHDRLAAALLAAIAVTTILTRQVLMPAINEATDTGAKSRFKWLHGLSVAITLGHIGLSGYVIARFAQVAAL
jgi:hypothetical protein